jgi:hypothetical protein
MKIEVKVRIILPRRDPGPPTRLYDLLAEAWERLDQTRSQDLSDAVGIDGLLKPQQRIDDHQVRPPVHVQPSRVGIAHSLPAHHGTSSL